MQTSIRGIGKKIGASALAFAMVAASGMGTGIFTDTSYADTANSTQKAIESNYSSVVKSNGAADKSETTYAVMTADGITREIDVDETLRNRSKAKTITDYSELSNIKNVSGNEKVTRSGNDLSWAANGNSITYQGKSSKTLPVTVQISYYLNGNKVTASQIAGKSGQVEIHFDYKVNQNITSNGYTMSHPFTMASGVVLSNEHFSNVSVSNGKNINDGSNNICLGLAFPGLSNALNISSSSFSIPESVVVTADTDDFQIDGTYTVAMSGVLGDLDTSKVSSAKSKVAELESGLSSLSSASAKLVSGTGEVAAGASKLNSSVQGVTIPTISLSQAQLDEIGKKAASDSSVTGASEQLSNGMIKAIAGAAGNSAEASATASAKNAAVTAAGNSAYSSVKAALEGAGVDASTAEMKARAAKTAAENSAAAADYSPYGTAAKASAEASAEASAKKTVPTAVGSVISQVAAGSAQGGAKGVVTEVNTTLGSFSTKFTQLKKGTADLSAGATELNAGMKTFNSDGIQKLVNSLDASHLNAVVNRLEAVADASKEPVLVGGKTSGMSCESKIIFKTDEVKK